MSPSKKAPLLVQIVNEYYGTDVMAANDHPTHDPANEAKYVTMLLIRRHTGYAYTWINDYFKYQNVRNRVTQVEARMKIEPKLLIRVCSIEKIFFQKLNKK